MNFKKTILEVLVVPWFFMVGCSSATEESSILSETTGSVGGLINCSPSGSFKSCALRNPDISIVRPTGINAEIKLMYTFTCPRNSRDSTIVVYDKVTGQKTNLKYRSVDEPITMVSENTLYLKDERPDHTSSFSYQLSADCQLSFRWSVLPASAQIKKWEATTRNLVELINLYVEIYDARKDIADWYSLYIAAPDAAGGLIQSRVNALSDKPNKSVREKLDLAAYVQILNKEDQALILSPYTKYRDQAIQKQQEAKNHGSVLSKWLDSIDAALTEAINKVI